MNKLYKDALKKLDEVKKLKTDCLTLAKPFCTPVSACLDLSFAIISINNF